MEIFIYNVFMYLMLFLLFLGGRSMERGNSLCSKYVISAIVVFTLNEGLRWGRGLDYNYYFYAYNDVVAGFEQNFEWLFTFIIRIFGVLKLTWQHFVLFMSACLILSSFYFMRHYKSLASWSMPLWAYFSLSAENLMRWYFAFSFILIGLYYLLKDNKKLFFLFCILGCGIHLGIMVVALLFYLIFLRRTILCKPVVSLPVYFALSFLFELDFMKNLIPLLNIFSFTGRFANYQENASYWLTGGYAGEAASLGISFILFYIMVDITGYYAIRSSSDRKLIYAYNLFIFSFMLLPIWFKIEILHRMFELSFLFVAIITAYVIKTVPLKNIKHGSLITSFGFWLTFLNFSRVVIIQNVEIDKYHCLYVWDKKGQDVLDVRIYYLNKQ